MKKAKSGRLTISRLTVRGVLGVEESTIDLSDVTVLEGANATGKSSHLMALRSALGIDRTALARLTRIRDGAPLGDPALANEEPSVEVLLVGDDREVLVSRKGFGSPEVRERVGDDWRKVRRPVEWLRDLIDVEAANPALWLAADDETKATAVLSAMPLEGYRRADAMEKAGLGGFHLPPIPPGLHPLEDLEQVEAAVFSARTETGRQERSEHDAAVKLLAGLPAEVPEDVAERIAAGETETAALADRVARQDEATDSAEREAVQKAKADFQQKEERAASDLKNAEEDQRQRHALRVEAWKRECERVIAKDLAEMETAKEHARLVSMETVADARATCEDLVARAQEVGVGLRRATERVRAAVAANRESLAGLRAQQQAAVTDRHVRATAAGAEAKAREHADRVAFLTEALEFLKRYRLELAERLPIKGLAVHFDEAGRKSLTLDGVPLSQVNKARLAELAVEVSLLRIKPAAEGQPYLPLVLLDDAEKLDPKAREALLRAVASRGSQVIAAVVGQSALRVFRPEASA